MEEERKRSVYRSSLRSQAMIKRALLQLMEKKSFDEITITDVVREANINRGTFYAHFHSTYEVLLKIQEDMFNELTRVLEEYKPDEVMEDPTPVFKKISEFLLSDISYYRTLFKYTRVQEYLYENKEKLFRYFLNSEMANAIEDGNAKREFIALLDFWISGIFNIYYDAVLSKIPLRLDEIPSFCTKIVKMRTVDKFSFLDFISAR